MSFHFVKKIIKLQYHHHYLKHIKVPSNFLMQSQLPQKSGFGLLKYFVKTTLKILQEEKRMIMLLLDEGTKKFFIQF